MKRDYIRRLRDQGKLEEYHVLAAAKYESLVYSGYSSRSLKLERVDCRAPGSPNLSGIPLSRLPRDVSKILFLVIIEEYSLVRLGEVLGARSQASAYRKGLEELTRSLDEANAILH